MVVNYSLNGKPIEQEASGSGRIIRVPLTASNVEVKFQVRRPSWGDVMKYDRFENCNNVLLSNDKFTQQIYTVNIRTI